MNMITSLCVAHFIIIVGARWWTIDKFGTDILSGGQWYGEGDVFKRYNDESLSISDWK